MPSLLFSPIKIREVEFKNRIVLSPMCQYSAVDGVPNQWHLVHLGARAVGGAGLIICEATAVSPEGRISSGDLGIWNQQQVEAFAEITTFITSQNAVPGIQLAHAGRKASSNVPWKRGNRLTVDEGAWDTLAPSAVAFDQNYPVPKEMTEADLKMVLDEFVIAAENAVKAGFKVAEIHMAHGYLLNEFLSPLSNHRTDRYGGLIENRMRYPLTVVSEVRKVWPQHLPLFVRISATEWMDGGWSLEDSVLLGSELKKLGVDLIDCSSGGNSSQAKIISGPGYQVNFSETVKRGAGIMTGAVGIIVEPSQAEEILQSGSADMIFIGRELLRDPHWPLNAAIALGDEVAWPNQYLRAKQT